MESISCGRSIVMAKAKKNNGMNRAQKRANARKPQQTKSSKPMWLRIAVIAVIAVMFLGIIVMAAVH